MEPIRYIQEVDSHKRPDINMRGGCRGDYAWSDARWERLYAPADRGTAPIGAAPPTVRNRARNSPTPFAAWRRGLWAVLSATLMFTGIVEETGQVLAFTSDAAAWRLSIAAQAALVDFSPGDSIAVNGCCLTGVRADEGTLRFDVLEETRRLTNFSVLRPGALVNLERSLRFGGKVGGHFVTGHIDALGTLEVFEPRGNDHYLRVRVPPGYGRYIVHKGSIAIDGISLTIAEVEGDRFAVWLIPHTLAVTNLREKRVGDPVNLEFDLLGKHVEKLLLTRTNS